jgi:hypothetical protein
MKTIHSERLGELVLARLSNAAKRPPSRSEVRKSLYAFVERELTATQWNEAFDRTLAALRAAGSVEDERLVLTERGRARLTTALGLRSAPKAKNWGHFQSKYLSRLFLELPSQTDEAAPNSATVLLAKRLNVPLEPRSTPTKVIDAWLARSLGLAGKLTLSELRATLLAKELQLPKRPQLEAILRLGVAQLAGATSGDAKVVRKALTSRWLLEPTPQPSSQLDATRLNATQLEPPQREPPLPESSEPNVPEDDPLRRFAVRVRRAADSSQVRSFGPDKAFIGSVWQALASDPDIRCLGEGEFKRLLVEAHRRGALLLERADLVAAMDPGDVRASEITDQNATYHFIHRGQPA